MAMVAGEQPITRTDLREELDRVLMHYATKEDLAKEVGDLRSELIKWIVGVQLGGIAALAAVVTAIITITKFVLGG